MGVPTRAPADSCSALGMTLPLSPLNMESLDRPAAYNLEGTVVTVQHHVDEPFLQKLAPPSQLRARAHEPATMRKGKKMMLHSLHVTMSQPSGRGQGESDAWANDNRDFSRGKTNPIRQVWPKARLNESGELLARGLRPSS